MKNKELDKLVASETIDSYEYSNEEFEPGTGNRETQKLILTFPDGMILEINTFCSGSAENTVLDFVVSEIV